MSAEHPLILYMSGLDDNHWRQFLQNPDRPSAEYVQMQFAVAEGNVVVLSDENGDGCLLKTKEDLVSKMGEICGQLPALSHLNLHFYQSPHHGDRPFSLNTLPVGALGALFQHSKTTLKSFIISGCRFHVGGSQGEFQCAWHHLSCMQRLEIFWMLRSRRLVQEQEERTNVQALPLFVALKNVDTIRKISLPGCMRTDTAYQCLQMLDQCQALQRLTLGFQYGSNFDPNAQITPQNFVDVVGNLTALKLLDLAVCLIGVRQSEAAVNQVVAPVLSGLQRNKALKTLKIRMMHYESSSRPVTPSNSILEGTKKAVEEHLNKALQTNRTLSQVSFFPCKDEQVRRRYSSINDPPKFWLKMNGIGRKVLLKDLQHKRWIATLVDQKDDHQVSFYLLSTNLSTYLSFLLQACSKGQLAQDSSSLGPQKKAKLNHP